jgi:peptidylprolyl isomerase
MMRIGFVIAAALAVGAPIHADKPALSPGEIVEATPASDWVSISPNDLLVMDLAPDAKGRTRRVVIHLTLAPVPSSMSSSATPRAILIAILRWWAG